MKKAKMSVIVRLVLVFGSDATLYIGAGKNLEAGSFFSGLIDDVRVYDRAVKP